MRDSGAGRYLRREHGVVSTLEIWLSIVAVTCATLLTRAGPLIAGASVQLPPLVQSALRYAPACALAAIVVPDLLMAGGRLDFAVGNPRLAAGVIATLVCLVTRGTLSTIGAGMSAFWLWRWLVEL